MTPERSRGERPRWTVWEPHQRNKPRRTRANVSKKASKINDMSDLLLSRRATISACGRYRYRLEREWSDSPKLIFVMLNPSTADADIDDPTIRRCMGFAQRENAGGIVVVNLFALRATNPKALTDNEFRPDGPDNFVALEKVLNEGLRIICAWGAHKEARAASRDFVEHAAKLCVPLFCLGVTGDGSPRHPLYVKANQALVKFPLAPA